MEAYKGLLLVCVSSGHFHSNVRAVKKWVPAPHQMPEVQIERRGTHHQDRVILTVVSIISALLWIKPYMIKCKMLYVTRSTVMVQ